MKTWDAYLKGVFDTLLIITVLLILAFFLLGVFVCAACAQENPVSPNLTETNLPDGRVKAHIKQNQNYYDATTQRFKKRNIEFKASGLSNKIAYREGHNVVVDTTTGYVNINISDNYVTFTPVNTDIPQVARERAKVNYRSIWKHVDYKVELLPEGTKETIILLDNQATKTFTFRAEFGSIPQVLNGGIDVGNMFIPAPTAYDARKLSVPLTWGLTGPVAGIYTYTVSVTPDTFVYPIAIDPTVIIKPAAAEGKDVYVTDQLPTNNYANTSPILLIGTTVRRDILIQFDVSSIPATSILNSATCSLYVETASQNGAPVFSSKAPAFLPIMEAWTEATVTFDTKPDSTVTDSFRVDFGGTTGWKVKTATDTTTGMGKVVYQWIAGGRVNYGWEIWQTLGGSGISWAYEVTSSDGGTAANRPSLTIVYTPAIKRAYNVVAKAQSADSIRVIYNDSSLGTVYSILATKNLTKIDSVKIPAATGVATCTLYHAGLSANTFDSLYIITRDSISSTDTVISALIAKYTSPTFGVFRDGTVGLSDTSFTVQWAKNGNPDSTRYAFLDTLRLDSAKKYISFGTASDSGWTKAPHLKKMSELNDSTDVITIPRNLFGNQQDVVIQLRILTVNDTLPIDTVWSSVSDIITIGETNIDPERPANFYFDNTLKKLIWDYDDNSDMSGNPIGVYQIWRAVGGRPDCTYASVTTVNNTSGGNSYSDPIGSQGYWYKIRAKNKYDRVGLYSHPVEFVNDTLRCWVEFGPVITVGRSAVTNASVRARLHYTNKVYNVPAGFNQIFAQVWTPFDFDNVTGYFKKQFYRSSQIGSNDYIIEIYQRDIGRITDTLKVPDYLEGILQAQSGIV